MSTIDFSPFYRNSIGFDRMVSLLENALSSEPASGGYPPYNIEVLDDNHYAITLAVAGFDRADLDVSVERGVLTVRGKKTDNGARKYLHQGIATRAFERKFNLADHVEVTAADINNGLLSISLLKEIPEAMKPRTIAINHGGAAIEHQGRADADGAVDVA